jgi:hypothetical protein
MDASTDIELQLQTANELIPVHKMWDGFWIYDFENTTLTISCSFDRIHYRNFDIFFYDVTFFNIPVEWCDTEVPGNRLFRLSNKKEFIAANPNFDPGNKSIFALDLVYTRIDKSQRAFTFYIVAERITAQKCYEGDARPTAYYKDPFKEEIFPCMKNKVKLNS